MPALLVSVSGHGESFSYTIPLSYSAFEVESSLIFNGTSIGRNGTTGLGSALSGSVLTYYIDATKGLVATPLDMNFTAPSNPFTLYQPVLGGIFLPPTLEPGGYSQYYPFLYGENNTVTVNMVGGGASATSVARGSSVYTTIYVSPSSGGAQSFWVRDGNGTNGRLLFSSPLLDNNAPPAPPGFEGTQTFVWAPDTNGTVTLGIVNSFGVSTPIGYYQATVHSAKAPNLDYALFWVLLVVCASFVVLGKLLGRRGKADTETED
jgi:hypothetical protein